MIKKEERKKIKGNKNKSQYARFDLKNVPHDNHMC